MVDSDRFEPRLGRIRDRGGARTRRYLGRVLAAANLARGGRSSASGKKGFNGSRIGRAAGVGAMLVSRGANAAWRQRRVIVKTRIVRLAGKGLAGAAAHLRYLQRDGTTRRGEPGALYDRESDDVDGREFHQAAAGDRHQFRLIVSPEDGADYDDLKPLTRRLMAQIEADLGTRLDWVAVDHFNTGHPHTHIIVRGKDDRGADLVIARDYLMRGIRERAAELVDLDLGPRSPEQVRQTLRAEISQERLTSIDRTLLREADADRIVAARGRSGFDQTLRAGRLARLAELGLAEPLGAGRWRLAERLDATLVAMGERGDIIRTMQRAFTRAALERSGGEQAIYDPAAANAPALVGRVIARGLADEHADRHYLIVDATDGRSHYVAIGSGDGVEPIPAGTIIAIEPRRAQIREVDRTVATIAAANGGRYDIDTHLRHDPGATQRFAETHVRRLEALRRAGAGVTRDPSGIWSIAPEHLERVAAYETRLLRDHPVVVETLSPLPLDRLIDADAATWLDREALADAPLPLRDSGFGREVAAAQMQRRQWLVEQGLAEEIDGTVTYRDGLLTTLQRREWLRVAGELASELGRPFAESANDEAVVGTYRRSVDLLSGRVALIERAHDFTLVPWRPVLERHVGKQVAGIVRESGISWTFGRGRTGPAIS